MLILAATFGPFPADLDLFHRCETFQPQKFATGWSALQSDGSIIVSGRDFRGSNFFSNPQPLLMRFSGASNAPAASASSASGDAAMDAALMWLLTAGSRPSTFRQD